MNRLLSLLMVAALLLVTACAAKPKKQFQRLAAEFVSPVRITKPVDQQSAVVGMTLKTAAWAPGTEDRVYLVKVDDERDLYQGKNLIPTSVVTPLPDAGGVGTVYVQNLPPGRYAAVAFSASEKGFGKVREVTLFLLPKETVTRSLTTVTAGGLHFMGEYEIGPTQMVLQENAVDEVQAHYFEVFWGKPLERVVAELQLIGTPAYFAVHAATVAKGQRDPAAEQRFLASAAQDLEPT
ncbi:MAG: hypothetical protein L6Q38_08090, partial [Nitrospira sp.]|nr:hypothetical protein [Nitrospira sp.]